MKENCGVKQKIHTEINTPKRILFTLARYKFAAKIIGAGNILEVGCGEGLGTWLLAKECGMVKGIDTDEEAIKDAKRNWDTPFECVDFLTMKSEEWDAVVALDVIEHIFRKNENRFFRKVADCLTQEGIAVIGTPNSTSYKYSSEMVRNAHINRYSWKRLKKVMEKYFHNVLMFGSNDEMVHTGYLPMAHYLIAVGTNKKMAGNSRKK